MKPAEIAKEMALMNAIWALLGIIGLLKARTLWGFVPFLVSIVVTLGLMWLAKRRESSKSI